jgi:hypothetical protein
LEEIARSRQLAHCLVERAGNKNIIVFFECQYFFDKTVMIFG